MLFWTTLVFSLVGAVFATPVGNHTCTGVVKHPVTVRVNVTEPVTYRTYTWCLKVPPRCSTYTVQLKDRIKIHTEMHNRTITVCCKGYVEIDYKCVPACPPQTECPNMHCNRTNHCYCTPGYTGLYCSNPCPKGVWGAECLKPCDCPDGYTCHHLTGDCMLDDSPPPKTRRTTTTERAEYVETSSPKPSTLRTTIKTTVPSTVTSTLKSTTVPILQTTVLQSTSNSESDKIITQAPTSTQNTSPLKPIESYVSTFAATESVKPTTSPTSGSDSDFYLPSLSTKRETAAPTTSSTRSVHGSRWDLTPTGRTTGSTPRTEEQTASHYVTSTRSTTSEFDGDTYTSSSELKNQPISTFTMNTVVTHTSEIEEEKKSTASITSASEPETANKPALPPIIDTSEPEAGNRPVAPSTTYTSDPEEVNRPIVPPVTHTTEPETGSKPVVPPITYTSYPEAANKPILPPVTYTSEPATENRPILPSVTYTSEPETENRPILPSVTYTSEPATENRPVLPPVIDTSEPETANMPVAPSITHTSEPEVGNRPIVPPATHTTEPEIANRPSLPPITYTSESETAKKPALPPITYTSEPDIANWPVAPPITYTSESETAKRPVSPSITYTSEPEGVNRPIIPPATQSTELDTVNRRIAPLAPESEIPTRTFTSVSEIATSTPVETSTKSTAGYEEITKLVTAIPSTATSTAKISTEPIEVTQFSTPSIVRMPAQIEEKTVPTPKIFAPVWKFEIPATKGRTTVASTSEMAEAETTIKTLLPKLYYEKEYDVSKGPIVKHKQSKEKVHKKYKMKNYEESTMPELSTSEEAAKTVFLETKEFKVRIATTPITTKFEDERSTLRGTKRRKSSTERQETHFIKYTVPYSVNYETTATTDPVLITESKPSHTWYSHAREKARNKEIKYKTTNFQMKPTEMSNLGESNDIGAMATGSDEFKDFDLPHIFGKMNFGSNLTHAAGVQAEQTSLNLYSMATVVVSLCILAMTFLLTVLWIRLKRKRETLSAAKDIGNGGVGPLIYDTVYPLNDGPEALEAATFFCPIFTNNIAERINRELSGQYEYDHPRNRPVEPIYAEIKRHPQK